MVPVADVGLATMVFGLDLVAVQLGVVRAQLEVALGGGSQGLNRDRDRDVGQVGAGDFERSSKLGHLLCRQRYHQLVGGLFPFELAVVAEQVDCGDVVDVLAAGFSEGADGERKSTRLNSSHRCISYA